MCVYGLSCDAPEGGWRPSGRLPDVWPLGRFAAHIDEAEFLLPRPIVTVDVDGADMDLLGCETRFTSVRVLVVATPRSDLALVIDGMLPAEADGEAVAAVLASTCFERTGLVVQGEPILEWLCARLRETGHRHGPVRFGRDVHQCVFPGGELLAQLRGGDSYWHIVYRIPARPERVERTGIFEPAALNYADATVVGHGRGVSVLAGWEEPVQNAFGLTAIMLVTALGVLHRARRNAFNAMTQGGRADLTSTGDARALISRLSARLNELQLDLSFGVEAYLDSVWIPELIVGAFQRSLCEALGLNEALEHTSRMLERLNSVIEIRRSALESAVQEQSELRDRILSWVVAVGTLIALPPAMLLAFFGANATQVDPRRSIFDLHAYWGAYLLAWLPYILIVCVWFVLQRANRRRSRQLRIYDEAMEHDGVKATSGLVG